MGDLGSKIGIVKLLTNFETDKIQGLFDVEIPWQKAIAEFLICWFDKSEFITVQTSGSTGKPKTIKLSKTAMRNSARMTNAYFGLNEKNIALLCLPASYIAGKMMLVRAIEGKFNLIIVEPTANPFAQLSQSIDFAAITPYQLQYSLIEIKKLESKKLEIRNIIVGGAKLNKEAENAVQQFRTDVYETYGMTETCSHIALRAVNGLQKSANFTVLPGISIRKNEKDCLCIKAPHLLPDEIATNDLVELIDYEHFIIKGRLDNIINTGGIKVSPEQIERELESIISMPFFISSKPDENLGNKIILIVESEQFSDEEERKLLTSINNKLDKYERPKEIIYLPQFCYSSANKLLKNETLKQLNSEKKN